MTGLPTFHNNHSGQTARRNMLANALGLLIGLVLAGCATQLAATKIIPATLAPTTIAPLVEPAKIEPTAEIAPSLAGPTASDTPLPTPLDPATPTATTVAAALPLKLQPPLVAPAQPINLPPGFEIGVYASGLNGPRMLAIGSDGQLYAADRDANRIVRLPDLNGDGVADGVQVVADNLVRPSSLAFYNDGSLYVGETTRILRLSAPDAQGVFQQRQVIINGLPSAGHNTRTVLFSPDWQTLFVSIGSSCNNCIENDPRRAAIMRYNPDGSGGQVFASGLRNAVGITFRPGTNELWATNNGRDYLGDDLPPETVNLVQQGNNFGWPRCQAGDIVDPELGDPSSCQGVTAPMVKMQAHSAPLGLGFYTGSQFPVEYRGGLFVAFHGSWNRSVPTGYKVVFIPFQDGKAGAAQDFATGWLANGGVWGRPVGVTTAPDGSLFVSDDSGGMIYRIIYIGG
jgi:glucose/arabinose dehydrogenase